MNAKCHLARVVIKSSKCLKDESVGVTFLMHIVRHRDLTDGGHTVGSSYQSWILTMLVVPPLLPTVSNEI